MQKFNTLTSIAIPLAMDNVDTDMIIPAQFLTKIGRDGYGEHIFERLIQQDANFVFNNPLFKHAEILIAQENFGCGSSREHAVWAILQANIKVVIAESFSDIFFSNAAKNGLLTISLAQETIADFMDKAKQMTQFTINLEQQTIKTSDQSFHFDYDPFRKECFLKGQDDMDYLLEATHA